MIGLYLRVSTSIQASEGLSLDIQREKGIRFAQSLGQDYRIFEDAGISGGSFEREQFQLLLSSIRSGELDAVWVISKDRLTRAALDEAISLRDFFIEHKTKLYIDGNLQSLSSPEDLLQSNIQDSIAEFQRLLTKKKTKEARQRQIDAGENTYSSIYGYNFRLLLDGSKEWFVDDDEAALVNYIFKLYFEDLNFDQICRRLSLEGYSTKLRGNWDRGTIHNILRRPEYIGMTRNTKGELVPSKNYSQIVDKAAWERVQSTIDSKIRMRQGKHFRAASYDLSGILTCGSCGSKFFFHSGTGRHGDARTTYAHKMITPKQTGCMQSPLYFNRPIADYLMRVLFEEVFSDYQQVQAYMKRMQEDLAKDENEIDSDMRRVQANIAELEKQRKRLVDAMKKGIVDDEDIREEMATIKNEITQQQANATELGQRVFLRQQNMHEVVNALSEDIVFGFKRADASKRREYYLKFCPSVQAIGYVLSVTFITGRREDVNIKEIPDSYMERMIGLYFQDQHPEWTENREPVGLVDAIYNQYPKEYYAALNEERESIRSKFLLKTKGRPRKEASGGE
jgi:site-specific DNA recombinase